MQIPGFLWTAILALIPLLVQWLGGDYFATEQWVPWAVMTLGLIAKVIELARAQAAPEGKWFYPAARPVAPLAFVRRFLLG